jgi:cytoskeleton protein RodZ
MDRSDNTEKPRDIPEDTSLGSLLRKAREERNIDLDEAVRATRIRRQNLEALENDEWSKLPSEVFVKGFLKSYAGFLGLDKEMVLNYYLKASPLEKYKPHALREISLQPRRWHLIILIPILALGLIGSIVYLKRKNISIVGKAFDYLVTKSLVEEKEYAVEQGADTMKVGVPSEDKVAAEETALLAETAQGPEVVEEPAVIKGTEAAAVEEGETALLAETAQGPEVVEEPAVLEGLESERPPSPRFTLRAQVNNRTWIAIYIDDGPAKEYLFQPGDTMKWTADKGFDILVGNAAGIDFFLNGKEVGYLGPEGKVVRLKLPEGM